MYTWKKLKSKNAEGYELLEKEEPVAKLVLADKKSSFKAMLMLENETQKIRRKGFWKSIIVIINEKEDIIARTGHQKLHFGRGVIEIRKADFFYRFVNSPLAELQIFGKDSNQLISYKIVVQKKEIQVELVTDPSLQKVKERLLLLIMGWYMFQPVVKENVITKWLQ